MTRRARHPVAVLAAVAAVPAVLLASISWWARTVESAPLESPPPVELVLRVPVGETSGTSTPLLSVRRSAPSVGAGLASERLGAALAEFGDLLNGQSCLAVSLDGESLAAVNVDTGAIPGSVEKLMVASVAEDVLGADFRYRTVVRGDLGDGGVVDGDLYLVGGGDPMLASDWYPQSGVLRYPLLEHTSLDTLADRVVEAGVVRVTGDLVGDGSRYDDEVFAPGWGPGVAGVDGGPIGALTANDALVQGESVRRSDPRDAAVREFARLLAERGVVIDGEPTAGVLPTAAPTELASIDSAPLDAIVREILRNSHNNTAEAIVREYDVAVGGGGAREPGLATVATELESDGVDLTSVALTDGSGLSRDNRLTCTAVLTVLQDQDPLILDSLAVLGESGTLTPVLAESPAAGRMLAKTGTLNNPPVEEDPPAAKALAGYLPLDEVGMIEFVLLLNGPSISAVEEYLPLWERLAAVLTAAPDGIGVGELGPR